MAYELPPVLVLSPDVSTNPLGRALLLADLIRDDTDVLVAGLQQRAELWPPAAGTKLPLAVYKKEKAGRLNNFAIIPWLRQVAKGRLVVVSKPMLQSLGVAVLAGIGDRGFVVDIDDWESGFKQERAHDTVTPEEARDARRQSYLKRGGLNEFALASALEQGARLARHRIVSNHWLQRRFGGEVLYHVRDPAELDPANPPGRVPATLPSDRVWVGFIGTARAHKGLLVLIDAVKQAQASAPVGLVLMGSPESEPVVQKAHEVLGDTFVNLPPFPQSELADHVRLADIVALPSLDVPAAWGQIPAKLFDAMSMAKPVVASAMNDIPEILRDAGLTVRPGDAPALAAGIVRLARDRDLRARYGQAARSRLITDYSYQAGRPILRRVLAAAAR